jgi:hypothetical protein
VDVSDILSLKCNVSDKELPRGLQASTVPYHKEHKNHRSLSGGQDSVIDVASRLRARRSGMRILVGARDFSLLQNAHTGSGAHAASYSIGTPIISRG